jgi:tetratricopeptide (TPR) repeat protein
MDEARLPVLDRLAELTPANPHQRAYLAQAAASRTQIRSKLGPVPEKQWKNLGELDQIVAAHLAEGRAQSAADILESAYVPSRAPWDAIDRAATLRLHLGQPERARELWRSPVQVPQPAVRDARIAAALLAEGQLDLARESYEQALKADPSLFEARYGLAILEQDAGRASASYEHAVAAIESAPTEVARLAARAAASGVGRFARTESSRAIP